MDYFIYALFFGALYAYSYFSFSFSTPHPSFSLFLVVVLTFCSLPPTSHTSPSLTPLCFPPPHLFLFPSLLLSPPFCSSPFPLAPLSFWPFPPLNPNFPLAPLFLLHSPLFLLLLPPSSPPPCSAASSYCPSSSPPRSAASSYFLSSFRRLVPPPRPTVHPHSAALSHLG